MLKELLAKLEKGRHDLAQIFEQAGPDTDLKKVSCISGTDVEKAAVIRKMNDDLEVLGKQVIDLQAVEGIKTREAMRVEKEKAAARPPFPTKEGKADIVIAQSFGAMFVDGKGGHRDNRDKELKFEDFSLKTLFAESGSSWAPQSLRTGRIVDKAVRPIQVLDIIPMERTSYIAVKYMEETTLDDSAVVEKAEAAAFGESALALTERSVTVQKLPVYLPVTDEQLEDVEQAQSYIDNRLPGQLMRRLDYQSLNGDGTGVNMTGVLHAAGLQSTLPAADDAIADVIARAIKDVRLVGRAIATAIVVHPTDFLTERLRKSKQGEYIWGNPGDPGIQSMWGLPVAQADSLAQGSAVVGDFATYAAYVEKRGVTVKTGYINDDFIKGRQAIRADLRGCFVWYRPAAFSQATLPA